MKSVNEAVLELAQQLPEECTWDEVMYRIFVQQKIEAGLEDADAGQTISHEEVLEEFAQQDDTAIGSLEDGPTPEPTE